MRGNGMTAEKPRMVQEYVPGKQVTLSHLISNPKKELCEKLGLETTSAIGILTITPSEAAIIAADVATKAADVKIGFMDRFTGSLVLVGTVSNVEAALGQVTNLLVNNLGFAGPKQTKS
jgi:ethanolamine utilization protein EutS